MKKIIYNLLSVLVIMATLNSCVKDTEYDTPQIDCIDFIPAVADNEMTINDMLAYYDGSVVEFGETNDYIVGYVVSDDRTGNFYKELYIQDAPVDPEVSVKLAIDMRSLYTKYNIGRKIYIYLDGLALDESHGEMVLGELINGSISMRENKAKEAIFRGCDTEAVMPLVLDSPMDVNNDYLGMYIQFNNMQFDLSLIDLNTPEDSENFVDPLDSFDTHRIITSCDDSATIRLETSTFANFKNKDLPSGSGSVKGILSRDYGDDFYVLRVNSPEDFTFTGERCDPDILDCGTASAEGANTLFEDDFSTYATYNPITGNGWTNYMQEGTEQWEAYSDSYSLGVSARLNPYNNGSASIISWLITPMINMDAQTGEVLTFKTSNSFSDTSTLEVLISNDWDGTEANITSATWAIVVAAEIVSDDTYYQSWVDSGFVDLSCAEGNSYIAFRFKGDGGGSSSTFNGTYELDDVKITSD
jgi:hypothetical protein